VNIWREVKLARAGLVESDTLEGTRSLIRTFLGLPASERAQMRVAARDEFLRSFDIEAVAQDLIRQIGLVGDASPANPDLISETRFR
jgi:hypothetical protein